MWLFLTVPWAGLRCVIVVFHDHAYLLFYAIESSLPMLVSFQIMRVGNRTRIDIRLKTDDFFDNFYLIDAFLWLTQAITGCPF